VPRSVWAWPNESRRNAYIDLQMRACWGEQVFKSMGQSVTLHAGEVLFSVPAAATWWRCSDKAVRLLMEWLEKQGLIAYPEGKQHRRMFRIALLDYWGEGASRGATKGASRGASNSSDDNGLEETGARAGARRRARAGARGIEDELRDFSLPTVERNIHTRTREGVSTKRCPEGWQPNDEHRQLALSLGVDLLSELEFFRDYTFATARKDWDATFRNWIRTAAERHSRTNGNGKSPPHLVTGEDSGELQRRRQQEMDRAEEEYQAQKAAWNLAIATRWESEPAVVKERIRAAAESEFEFLRSDAQRFKKAVGPRTVQLYAEEIRLPAPQKRPQ
jgi:hypothetical protein